MGCPQMNLTQSFAVDGIVARASGFAGEITLGNPKRKNAVSLAMWQAIPEAINWLTGEGGARVIVLKGAGNTDFSAGADISEFAEVRKDAASAIHYEAANSAAFAAIREASVPVIACIRGICYGGALGLAAACDLRFADETARFAVPAAKLGLAYPADAMSDIVDALGLTLARLAVYSGRTFTAADLAGSPFLAGLSRPDELDETVAALAAEIAANAPLSIRATKTAIRAATSGSADLLALAASQGAATFESEDYAEGRRAFAEKRKPAFTGR